MVFTTFKYGILKSNIFQLEKAYNALIGRYVINGRRSSFSQPEKNSLEILIDRTEEYVIKCKTDRVTQCAIFKKLISEIRDYIKGTEDQIRNATYYLLGALIHRHYRLVVEDKKYNKSYVNPLSFFSYDIWNITQSRLGQGIHSALQLDMQCLDVYTIVNALQVFRQNMLLEVEDFLPEDKTKTIKQPRYMFYPHFLKEDKDTKKGNFKVHLNDIIEEHEKKGAEVFRQFHAISFMQSLVRELEKDTEPVEKEIGNWIKALSKIYADFSALSQEIMVRHLNDYFQSKLDKVVIKEEILILINIGYEKKNFEDIKDYSLFLEKINMLNTDESRCILCGGYYWLLHSGKVKDNLLMLMFQSLGLNKDLNPSDQYECINLLKRYIGSDSAPGLDCIFWGSKDIMQNQIIQLWVFLAQKLQKQEAKESNTTVFAV